MASKTELEKRIAEFKGSDVSRGIMPGNSQWFLNAGVILQEENELRSSTIGPEDVFGMSYIHSGSAIYKDDRGITQRITAGQVYQRLPNHIIEINRSPNEKWLTFIFSFPAPFWDALHTTIPNLRSQIAWNISNPEEFIEEILQIRDFLELSDEVSRIRALGRMQSLALRFYRNNEQQNTNNDPDIYEKAKIELGILSADALSVPELAWKFKLGYETFRKGFKTRFGESPNSYRIRIRMESACNLLSKTNLPVTEISLRLGYADVFSFSRQFGTSMNCSPSQYRKLYGPGS